MPKRPRGRRSERSKRTLKTIQKNTRRVLGGKKRSSKKGPRTQNV